MRARRLRRRRYGEDDTEAEIGRDVRDIMRGRPVRSNGDGDDRDDHDIMSSPTIRILGDEDDLDGDMMSSPTIMFRGDGDDLDVDMMSGRSVGSYGDGNGLDVDRMGGRSVGSYEDEIELPADDVPEGKLSRKQIREKKKREKDARMEQRRRETPYVFISYSFVLIFLSLIIYLVYFNIYKRDAIQNSSYNRRQDTQAQYVVRGSILSSDGATLASTTVSDGTDYRDYPYGRIFAHVVGFSTNGKSGLESIANYDLLTSHHNVIDRVMNEFQGVRNPGDNIVTTLSASLQETCYNVLGDYRGAVLVMDPKTGAILSMVSKPDFNPGSIAEDWEEIVSNTENSQLVNRATQGLYPPGSVFKIVTGLSYYQKLGTLDGFSFNCEGALTIGDHTVHCFNSIVHGQEDLPAAFANSCNCAFSSIGLDLGADSLGATAGTLLFGKKLPCDLEYKRSRFSLKTSDGKSAMMQTAFGQGDTLTTPYHMGLIVSAIANDGILMQPQLISKIMSVDGATVRENKASEYRRILTESEAKTMQSLLEGVVTRGTASELSGLGYTVAGKTGSAEYYLPDGQIGTHSWFVGYSNVEDPDIVVVVLAENGGAGSQTAVPMAHQIFDAYYYG